CLLDQRAEGETHPGDHHGPSFHAAMAVNTLLQRRQLHDRVDVQGLGLFHKAVNLHGPRPGTEIPREPVRLVLVSAEFVVIVVIGDVFERSRLFGGAELALSNPAQLRAIGRDRLINLVGRAQIIAAGQSGSGSHRANHKLTPGQVVRLGRDLRGRYVVGLLNQHGASSIVARTFWIGRLANRLRYIQRTTPETEWISTWCDTTEYGAQSAFLHLSPSLRSF